MPRLPVTTFDAWSRALGLIVLLLGMFPHCLPSCAYAARIRRASRGKGFDCSEVASSTAAAYGVQSTWVLVEEICLEPARHMSFVPLNATCGQRCRSIEAALGNNEGKPALLKASKGPAQLLSWLFNIDDMKRSNSFDHVSFYLESRYYGSSSEFLLVDNMSDPEDDGWKITKGVIVDMFPFVTNEELLVALAYLDAYLKQSVVRNDLRFFYVESTIAKPLRDFLRNPSNQRPPADDIKAAVRDKKVITEKQPGSFLRELEGKLLTSSESAYVSAVYSHVQNVVKMVMNGLL